MAEVEGTGSTFGGAFRAALGSVHLGHARGSYTRTTPTGQFRQLFGSQRGYEALRNSGLEVRQQRTIQNWLDGTSTPNKANANAIRRAYESMRKGGTPEWVRNGKMEINGQVAYGQDVRNRGDGIAPLRVDLSAGSAAGWDRIDGALSSGASDGEIEELVAEELIAEDVGDSYSWGFPGGSYSVGVSR